ncbi:hypothetical protein BJ741DRAFT_710695 [Chytriomyces cf. hyalinus JEL632]|nr:hypothetical protein BJ741DRAFT_710695 [Chytriomyces cf. hyalinus JEL632]
MKTVKRGFNERASDTSGGEHGPNERESRIPRSSSAAEPTSQSEPRSDVLEAKLHKIKPPRPVLNEIAFASAETIIVIEDQEDQQFCNETTCRPPTDFVSQPSLTSKGTIPRRPTSTFFNEWRLSPGNLKMRKSSTPSGSINFDGALDVKSDPFFSSSVSCSPVRERFNIARPVNPDNQITTHAYSPSPAHQMQHTSEFQGFINHQYLIEERHTSTARLTQSFDNTSTTPTRESALSGAKIVKPHPLGGAAAIPSATQIRVIAPTRAMGSELCMQSSPKVAVSEKIAVELDLLIPPAVTADGLGSGEETFVDEDEETIEDQAAVMVSSKAEKKASVAVTTFDACGSA